MNVVALLTDFGRRDSFVGTMKGVIYSINPKATIIDISHEVGPQNVDEAAFILWSVYCYFPKKTVFVVVIDPGVGSKRKILCVKTANYFFLAPDNGVLKYVLSENHSVKIVEVTNPKYWLPHVSSTFHGRDIFSPLAAHLSTGLPFTRLGKKISTKLPFEKFLVATNGPKKVKGKIIYIDHFGNLITNIYFKKISPLHLLGITVRLGKKMIKGITESYSLGNSQKLIALINSLNLLEIAVRNDSAAKLTRAKIGDTVSVKSSSA